MKTHNFDVDQVILCKALIGHCLQHLNFVTIPVVQQLYAFSLQKLFNSQPDDWHFEKYLSILTDLFFKIGTHKFDPRRDKQDKVQIVVGKE